MVKMQKAALCWVLLAIAAITLGCSNVPAQRTVVTIVARPNEPTQLIPVPLRLRAAMEKSKVAIGEPVVLNVFLENIDTDTCLPLIHDPNSDFHILLRDSGGFLVPWTRFGKSYHDSQKYGSGDPSIEIQSKQAACFRIRLDELFDLTREGGYSASVEFEFGDDRPPS